MDLSKASPLEILTWARDHESFLRDAVTFMETGVYDTDLIEKRGFTLDDWQKFQAEGKWLLQSSGWPLSEIFEMANVLGVDNLLSIPVWTARDWHKLVVEYESVFLEVFGYERILEQLIPMGIDYSREILRIARETGVRISEYEFDEDLPVERFETLAKGGLSQEDAEWIHHVGLSEAEVAAVTAKNKDLIGLMKVLHGLHGSGVAPEFWQTTVDTFPKQWLVKSYNTPDPTTYGLGLFAELLDAGWTGDDRLPMEPNTARKLLQVGMRPFELDRWRNALGDKRQYASRRDAETYAEWGAELAAAGIRPSHVSDYVVAVSRLADPTVKDGILKLVAAGIGPKEIRELRDRVAPKKPWKNSPRGTIAQTPDLVLQLRDRLRKTDQAAEPQG